MTAAEALLNAPEFTVSELSSALKRTVEDAYGHVRVRGEISGFRGAHSSGHCYFALKDESAKIEAVIWKGVHSRIRFKPQEGLEVIATGKLTTYPGSSKYPMRSVGNEPPDLAVLVARMAARRDRRGDVADRGGDSRHPASAASSLPSPRARVASQGAGRRLG